MVNAMNFHRPKERKMTLTFDSNTGRNAAGFEHRSIPRYFDIFKYILINIA